MRYARHGQLLGGVSPLEEEMVTLRHINEQLVYWAMQKYKRLRHHKTRAIRWLAALARREPHLFAHWRWGIKPDSWTIRAG